MCRFAGDGQKIGRPNEETVVVPDTQSDSEEEEEVNTIIIKLWRQGFTVNDGELRLYEKPENKEFLQCLEKG